MKTSQIKNIIQYRCCCSKHDLWPWM